ncbi:MAG: nitrate- and nitrite sensing domain-containing protein [Streptosporangiales bacterium]
MGLHLRSIRQKILLLVLVPVLSLIGLYIFATSLTARATINLSRTDTLRNVTGLPTGNFLAAVDQERPLALVYLSRPTGANLAALEYAESKTSTAAVTMGTALNSSGTMGNASAGEKGAITALLKDVAGLPALRSQVRAQIITRPAAFTDYNNIVLAGYAVLNQVILQETNAKVVAQSLAFVRMGKSEEMLLREDALVLADFAAGSFPAADRQQFTELAGARRILYAQTLADLTAPYYGYYARNVSPAAMSALTALEDRLAGDTATNRPPAVPPAAWQQAVGGVAAGLSKAGTQASAEISTQASADARSTYVDLALAGGLGLLAVALSIVVSVRVGRSMVRELRDLRDSALDLANVRLPSVVSRLAAGEDVDVAAEAPGLPASSDEIGQVRQAFAAVQQTAVEAAVGQARLRQGISDIFRNLARRSQSLLHRQLTLLDAMERRAREPHELEDLFRIDHLTTRMRRHAESLIILSGEAPARGWRRPVPFVDVLRAAVAEVEDYTRIKVTATTRAAISGPAVADVIHLIAELAENAVVFSPPNTPVLITGDVVGRGFAVEIEDRGLGLSEERREELNALLENPPPFDASGSDRLGLFVASQLARKHNIRVSLRASPYGGTTAIVLIPLNLVVPEDGYDGGEAASTSAQRGVQLTGRHAARDEAATFSDSEPGPTRSAAELAAEIWRSADTPDPWTVSAAEPGPELPGTDIPGAEPADAEPAPAEPASPAPAAATSSGHPGNGHPGNGHPGNGHPETARPFVQAMGGHDTGAEQDEADFLPRRVRQASLVPQLRSAADRAPSAAGPAADEGGERSPEEARSTITAIQRGWERGRSLFEAPVRVPDRALADQAAGADQTARADGDTGDAGPEPDPGAE